MQDIAIVTMERE